MSLAVHPVVLRPRDAVYSALKRAILMNELQPNAALTELGLAQSMGCSQGTVREALLRLQEDGLVRRSGHRGTSVTPLDSAAAVEMLALRRQIETRAAPVAAPAIDAAVMVRLVELRAEMDRHARAGDAFALAECDIRFHLAIFRQAGFEALEPILNRVMLHTYRHKLWEPRHSRALAETAARHDAILAAIPLGGAALAEALGRHIDTIVEIDPDAPAVASVSGTLK